MELFSSCRRHSIERPIEYRIINGRSKGNWLIIQIMILLFVTSVISESVKVIRRADKDSVGMGFRGKSDSKPRLPRFIKFDSESRTVEIELEMKIPFLKIPLQNKDNKISFPVIELNYKSLLLFGALMGIITFIIPLIFTDMPNQPAHYQHHFPNYAKEHKRSDRSIELPSYFEESINEILVKNSKLAPCMERLVCSAVATAKNAEEPTSFAAIIDTLSSHSLFEQAINGTVIKNAAENGRQVVSPEDCVKTSNECAFNQKILLNILKMIGL